MFEACEAYARTGLCGHGLRRAPQTCDTGVYGISPFSIGRDKWKPNIREYSSAYGHVVHMLVAFLSTYFRQSIND